MSNKPLNWDCMASCIRNLAGEVMKTMKLCLVCFLLACPWVTARAAGDTPLTGAHAFDFWIGNWDISQRILQRDGSYIEANATTSVSPILDGHALIERWQGQARFFWTGMDTLQSIRGFSIRYFDPDSGKWNIRWMDTTSKRLGEAFTGSFHNGEGRFYHTRKTQRGTQLSRITFSAITHDSVDWHLAISNDGGSSWTALWIMKMKRHTGP